MRPYFLLLAISPSLVLAACGGSTDSTAPAASGSTAAGGTSAAGAGGSSSATGGTGVAGAVSTGGGSTGGTGANGGSSTAGTSAAGGASVGAGGHATAGTGGSPVGMGGNTPAGAGGEPTGGGGASAGTGGSPVGAGGAPLGGGGMSAGAGGASAGAGGAAAGSAGAAPCPATPPTPGTSCVAPPPTEIPGAQCTYGDSVVGNCRQQFTCENGMWLDASTPSVCPAPGTMGCPATAPTSGDMCTADGADCGFPDGTICNCSACHGDVCMPGSMPTWDCAPPSSQPGCPPIAPNAGSTCSSPATDMCYYGPTCSGEGAVCNGGYWSWELLLCGLSEAGHPNLRRLDSTYFETIRLDSF